MDRISIRRTVAPTVEPLTTSQAKKQLEIADDDTTHDDQIELLITAAREQWEHDTDSATTTQTWEQVFPAFTEWLRLSMRPLLAVSSITYYDMNNTQQTLADTVYVLDPYQRHVRLKPDQDWPTTYDRWDAVKVTFTAGYGATGDLVPAIARQAMLLWIGYAFENRDMMAPDQSRDQRAYEMLVRRFHRSSYP